MDDEVRRFKRKQIDDLREAQAHKNDSPAAREVWIKIIKDIKEIDAAIRNGASTLAEIKTAISHNTSLVSEINKELGISEEVVVAEETIVEPEQTSDGGVFSARLEALISSALQDGVLTEQEKAILKKRAEKEGEDWDEVEMILNARLAERQPTPQVENGVDKNNTKENDKVEKSTVDGLEKQLESQYLIVNGTVYKEFSESKINEDTISKVSGLDSSDIISVTIPTCVKKIDKNAFNWSRHLEEITIPSSVTTIGEDAFGIIPSDGSLKKVLLNCPIIPSDIFNGAPLEEVMLGDCVNIIEDTAFANCENLASVTIPCNVIEIGDSAFQSCANLKKVDLSKCNKLESIGSDTFGWCEKLTEIDFSNCVSLKHCGGDAFEACPNIRTIDFSRCTNLSIPLLNISGDNLEKLILPPGQKSFNAMFVWNQFGYPVDTSKCNNVKVVYNEAFSGMNIKEITIPDTVESIGKNAFDECENLKTIVMPAALKEIQAPLGCNMKQLKKVDFSKVTQLRTIPKELFSYGCYKLKELIIPNGVTEIEDDAFEELDSLKRLFLPPTLESIGDLELKRVSIYCFSPLLEELEPIVYGWDDEDDDDWDEEDCLDEEELEELKEEKKKIKINLFVLPQYLDKYIAQRKAERIPEDVLIIQEIPEEYRYYYDN
jgi:hypothetical protein